MSDWIFVAEGRAHARTHSSTRASPVMVLMVLGGERGKEGCVREERKEGKKKTWNNKEEIRKVKGGRKKRNGRCCICTRRGLLATQVIHLGGGCGLLLDYGEDAGWSLLLLFLWLNYYYCYWCYYCFFCYCYFFIIVIVVIVCLYCFFCDIFYYFIIIAIVVIVSVGINGISHSYRLKVRVLLSIVFSETLYSCL